MIFATMYEVTEEAKTILNELPCYEDVINYSEKQEKKFMCFIGQDVHRFVITRVTEGYNDDFELEEGSFLVEEEYIDKTEVIEWMIEEGLMEEPEDNFYLRNTRDEIIDNLEDSKLFQAILRIDDERGLENWDYASANSEKEAMELVQGNFSI